MPVTPRFAKTIAVAALAATAGITSLATTPVAAHHHRTAEAPNIVQTAQSTGVQRCGAAERDHGVL